MWKKPCWKRKTVIMFTFGRFEKLNDYFLPLSQRQGQSVFFCRIDGLDGETQAFIREYYDAARKNGVIVDGRIPNPDVNQLAYFSEMLGTDFRPDRAFLDQRLRSWLPRMSDGQRGAVAAAMDATLQDLQRRGKTESILRNAYTKYMCWLYYKFERIVGCLGAEDVPKILYDGDISGYELQLLTVLSRAGADIVVLERGGEASYQKLDPASEWSILYHPAGAGTIPDTFNLKAVQAELNRRENQRRLYGPAPEHTVCTNAWMERAELEQAAVDPRQRGSDPALFYNAFIAQYGAADKLTYASDLFALYQRLRAEGRKVCIVDGKLPPPTPEEIAAVRRQNCANVEQLAATLSRNIQSPAGEELHRLMVKAFLDLLLEEAAAPEQSINKLTNKAVYLLAWLARYQRELFSDWKAPQVPVFILFGEGCTTAAEALFVRMLARLPVDVLVLMPGGGTSSVLRDEALLELRCEATVPMDAFPQAQTRVSTAAYQAERELDTLMYQDTGLYRTQQYAKAETVTLRAMYEEISILWDQELKYRPNFGVQGDTVTMPVLLEKVCGVKDGQTAQYWLDIKKLITPDTLVIRSVPYLTGLDENPMKPFATQFLQNGRLRRDKIKSHKAYPYGILRPAIQEYLLDKLALLLERRIIAGTYENGTEYTIVATVLNLNRELLRLIQKFDFTKKNPKLIVVNTTEKLLSLEDSILVAFLNLVGFDIVFFVPTGYQCIEKYFNGPFANERQLGEYLYDLAAPNFDTLQEGGLHSIRKLFGRSF